MKYPKAEKKGITNATHPKDIKVRLAYELPSVHKNSKKLIGLLRSVYTDREDHQRGVVYFPFLNERFIIPLSLLLRVK